MNAVRAELRKMFTTKMWWALLIPVVLVSMLINAFGGLFEDLIDQGSALIALPSLLPLSLGYTLSQTSVLAAVAGTVAAAGEFRHRTITTTYLLSSSRTAVLAAKLLVSAMLGAIYGLAAAAAGSLIGLVSQSTRPDFGELLATIAIGTVVCALWAVLGAGVGIAIGNQVGSLLLILIYLLLGELIITLALRNADSESVQQISSYLPGNAGDIAVLTIPTTGLAPDPQISEQILEVIATVTNPPAWGVALLVLALWAGLAAAFAAVFGARRDIT